MKKVLKKINNLKLFHKLFFAFILTIILPGIISYSIATENIKRITNKQVHNDLIYSVDITQNWLNDYFERFSSAMIYAFENENFNELIRVQNNSKENINYKYQRLREINKIKTMNMPIINDIVGNNIYITVITSDEISCVNYTYNEKAQKQLDAFLNEPQEYISQYITWKGFERNYYEETDTHVISLIKYVFDDIEKNLLGVIVLSIPEAIINHQLKTENEGHIRLLLDENMMIVASSDSSLNGKSLSFICDYKADSINDAEEVFTVTTNQNRKAMAFYRKINGNNWTVLELRDTSLFLEDVLDSNKKVLGVILVFIVIFFLIALFIAKSITFPLKRLSSIMKNTDYYLKEFEYQGEGTNEIHILEDSFSIMKKNMLSLIEENKQKERSKREAELQALQAQIRPHFLFNTLNSIRWTCVNNNNKKAAEMVLALNNLLRMTINKEDALISLKEEIDNLGYYISIIKMRHSMMFEMIVEVKDELLNYQIPRLLLQPIVENCIFHGFENRKSDGIIKIKAIENTQNVIITVEDNGKGISGEVFVQGDVKKKCFTGIGVPNVDERIKLHYGNEYGLKIESIVDKGTKVTLNLPIECLGDGE